MYRRVLTLVAAVSLIVAVQANASITLTSLSPYTESFDSLPSTGSTALDPTVGNQQAIPGTSGFVGTKIAGTGATLNFLADNGTNNSGRLASLGTTDSGERALGELASGSNACAFGVEIINNTGFALTSVDFAGFREMWRSSTSTQNVLTFAYAVSGGSATASNFLTDASLTTFASLDLIGEPPVASNGAVDGNASPNRAAVSGSIPVSLPNGASLYIRWSDFNDIGNDAALALDDLTITPVPEPASMLLMALGAVAALRRRR
jgi:hypothetical protein